MCPFEIIAILKINKKDLNLEISSNWLVLIWTNIDVEAEYWK